MSKLDVEKAEAQRDQISNICSISETAREFQKNIYLCFIDYTKAFDCVDHNKLWKAVKEMGIPGHLICLTWWDGWMASLMQWTWTWANSGRWWRTGRPGVLQSMGSQRFRHKWVTEQKQQNLYVEILNVKVILLGGGGVFERWPGSEGGALMDGFSALTKETQERSLPPFPTWGNREKTVSRRHTRKRHWIS